MDSYASYMDTLNQEVALRVAATITNQNRSKKSVAEASGIPLTTFIRKLENKTPFTIPDIGNVAVVLQVHPVTLFPAAFHKEAVNA